MKTKKKSKKIIVSVVGHDRWSGPELLYTKEYKSLRAAENFCAKFNTKNYLPTAPDYYETAAIEHFIDCVRK